MLKVELELSNEDARRAADELAEFLKFENSRMAVEIPDPLNTAALGWVVGDKVRRAISRRVSKEGAIGR